MNCQGYDEHIGDYVDGTLNESTRTSFEMHLSTCARCQALVADFSTIRTTSLSLDAQVPPPQVWTKLSAAIEAEPRSISSRLWGSDGMSVWRMLGTAAAALTLLASLSWTAARLAPIATEQNQIVAISPASSSKPAATIDAEYQLAERHLTSAIEGLEQAAQDRAALDMETRDVLQANLTVLDGAIGESREALQKEPENDVAQESLFDALRNKVALLQETIALINEMRKGNQEGAARIVSGLNQ